MVENLLSQKSLVFAAKTIKFCIKLNERTKESIITKQFIFQDS